MAGLLVRRRGTAPLGPLAAALTDQLRLGFVGPQAGRSFSLAAPSTAAAPTALAGTQLLVAARTSQHDGCLPTQQLTRLSNAAGPQLAAAEAGPRHGMAAAARLAALLSVPSARREHWKVAWRRSWHQQPWQHVWRQHCCSPGASFLGNHCRQYSAGMTDTQAAGTAGAVAAGGLLAKASSAFERGLASLAEGRGQTVAVGVSGGVDSAVAALLLKERGYDVVGVFTRNWDEGEEVGNQNCSVERDLRDAAAVCRQLGIPLHEADFVTKYWTQVFEDFLAQCSRGLTPNPDLACNRHIKFDALLDFAAQLGAPLVATGHYARLCHLGGTGGTAGPSCSTSLQLLRGADPEKDQTYFLASIQQESLQRVLFPVGGLRKAEVRQLALARGLVPAERRSSAGICFIGRRNFADFLAQYIPPLPGTFVSVDSGKALGVCPNILTVTLGQRPGIGGAAERTYVAGKDMVNRVVYVCQGHDHPALLTRTALLRMPHWLSPQHQGLLAEQGFLRCQYKARYRQQLGGCTLVPAMLPAAATGMNGNCVTPDTGSPTSSSSGGGYPSSGRRHKGEEPADTTAAAPAATAGQPFQPSTYTRLLPQDEAVLPGYLVALFDQPEWGVTPQQAFVVYDGEVCLGSALIAVPGRTLQEESGGEAAGSRGDLAYGADASILAATLAADTLPIF